MSLLRMLLLLSVSAYVEVMMLLWVVDVVGIVADGMGDTYRDGDVECVVVDIAVYTILGIARYDTGNGVVVFVCMS